MQTSGFYDDYVIGLSGGLGETIRPHHPNNHHRTHFMWLCLKIWARQTPQNLIFYMYWKGVSAPGIQGEFQRKTKRILISSNRCISDHQHHQTYAYAQWDGYAAAGDCRTDLDLLLCRSYSGFRLCKDDCLNRFWFVVLFIDFQCVSIPFSNPIVFETWEVYISLYALKTHGVRLHMWSPFGCRQLGAIRTLGIWLELTFQVEFMWVLMKTSWCAS